MKGQLQAHPLVELLREIADRHLSGALRLGRERVKAVVYAEGGAIVAARSNLRLHRLDETLRRWKGLDRESLSDRVQEGMSEAEILAALVSSGALAENEVVALQMRLCADVLRPLLLWTDGHWMFDARARLEESAKAEAEIDALLLEAARRLPASFVAARAGHDEVNLSANASPPAELSLVPAEAFVFSRIAGGSLTVGELVALSGLPEDETRHIIYTLLVSRLLLRHDWPQALASVAVDTAAVAARDAAKKKMAAATQPVAETKEAAPSPAAETPSATTPTRATEEASAPAWNLQTEIAALSSHTQATNLYALLAVAPDAGLDEIKRAYYSLAKRFHPDRFHKDVTDDERVRIEKSFAKIAHAYEILKDPKQRSVYDSKLKLSAKAPPSKTSSDTKTAKEPNVHPAANNISTEYRAEDSFRQGLAALQQNNPQMAVSHLAQAARLMPRNGRYRAYYGQALAHDPRNRRLAENELLAASTLEPRNAAFRIMLAELYLQLNMRARAAAELQRALDADPQNTTARRLLRNLKNTE